MTDRETAELVGAYVLHQRPYRDSSQLLDCLTETHGRVGLVARGSRRPRPGRRAFLQPFVPLRLSWVRRGELGTLTDIEAAGLALPLTGNALLAGFYVNELLLRLTARGDANAQVFSCYSECVTQLATAGTVARSLRLFELRLLHALGYGLALDCDVVTGEPIQAGRRYRFELERGPVATDADTDGADLHWGRELIALREGCLGDPDSLRAARRLLERALSVYLGDRPLRSRLVLNDIFQRGLSR